MDQNTQAVTETASPWCINCQYIKNSIDLIIILAQFINARSEKYSAHHSQYHITDHKNVNTYFLLGILSWWLPLGTAVQTQPMFHLLLSFFPCRGSLGEWKESKVHFLQRRGDHLWGLWMWVNTHTECCNATLDFVGRKEDAYISCR